MRSRDLEFEAVLVDILVKNSDYTSAPGYTACSLTDLLLSQNLEALELWFVCCIFHSIDTVISDVDGVEYQMQFSGTCKVKSKTTVKFSKGYIYIYIYVLAPVRTAIARLALH